MTSAPAKPAYQMSPQPEHQLWTYKGHDEPAWESGLHTSETFSEQPARIRFAEPPRDETYFPERPSLIPIYSLGQRGALRNLRIIVIDRIETNREARIIKGPWSSFWDDVPTRLEIGSRFFRDVTARTDVQTEEDQKAESFVREAVLRILNVYAEDDFEPGFVSPLEREFCHLIDSHGDKAINAMQGELQANRASTSALAEMVRVFGRVREDLTFEARYRVCVRALDHPELTVRDAAALALCDLADPRAKSALREAAAKESDTLIRTSHLKIADWLESLTACQPSSEN